MLSCRIPEGDLLDSAQQEVVLGFLRGISEGLDPSFANLTYADGLGMTGLERTLGPPWKLPYETIPTSRQALRGYEWWTICPKELAGLLGGAGALRATGAFHDVVRLPSGALWLRWSWARCRRPIRRAGWRRRRPRSAGFRRGAPGVRR